MCASMTPTTPAKKSWIQRLSDGALAWFSGSDERENDYNEKLIQTCGAYGEVLETKRLSEFDVGPAHRFHLERTRTYISGYDWPGSTGFELLPAEHRLIRCTCGWKLAEGPFDRSDPEKQRASILHHQQVAIVEYQAAEINRRELGGQ